MDKKNGLYRLVFCVFKCVSNKLYICVYVFMLVILKKKKLKYYFFGIFF